MQTYCACISLCVCVYASVYVSVLLTFAATSDEVLVQSSEARVYRVVALC